MGTGQRLAVQVDASEFHTAAELLHTVPYARPNGISRTIAISSRRIDQLTADTSELEADLTMARLEYGYQVAERQSVRFGLGLQDAELITGALASNQLVDWVRNNGNPKVQGDESSTDYLTAEFLFGWHHDTRDRNVFPSRGVEQRLSFKIAVPGSEIEYYASYPFDDAGTQFVVSLNRNNGLSAPNSNVILPEGFVVMLPVSGTVFSRGQLIDVVWAPSGTAIVPSITITVDCVLTTGIFISESRNLSPPTDSGATSIAVDSVIPSGPINTNELCEATVYLARLQYGNLDTNYGEGGLIRAEHHKRGTFLVDPGT